LTKRKTPQKLLSLEFGVHSHIWTLETIVSLALNFI
jgi:hypothetical protein